MKRIVTLGIILFLGTQGFSQIEKGTFLIDGSSSIDFSNDRITDTDPSDYFNSESKDNQGQINANVLGGYFIIKGLVVGVQLDYNNVYQTSESTITDDKSSLSINSFSVAPTMRYYIGDIGLWGQVSYGLGKQIQKYEDSDFDIEDMMSSTIGDLGIKLGYAIFLGEKVSLNPSFGYSMKRIKSETTDFFTGETIDVTQKTAGINFNFGIALHL